MSDPIPTPGVRPGQVWERIKPKPGKVVGRVEITGLGMGDVYCVALDADGKPMGPNRNLSRVLFEQRYRLVSEGGAPDA